MSKHFLHFFFSFTFFFHFFSGRNKKIQKCLTCDTHTHTLASSLLFVRHPLHNIYTNLRNESIAEQANPSLPTLTIAKPNSSRVCHATMYTTARNAATKATD